MASSTPTIGLMSELIRIPYHKEIMGELMIDPSYPFVLLEMDLDKFEKTLISNMDLRESDFHHKTMLDYTT